MTTQGVDRLLDLAGQAAIVTGEAKGIGQAIAERLAQAAVAIVDADLVQCCFARKREAPDPAEKVAESGA
jgi:NAD(P)-dependent dehydrogenase (short-subunit alcohol dehydrogenase family)